MIIGFQNSIHEFRCGGYFPARSNRLLASFRDRTLHHRSRTVRRWTLNFLATPAIVPMPNSYSLRICSNSSTFLLQSNELLRRGLPDPE